MANFFQKKKDYKKLNNDEEAVVDDEVLERQAKLDKFVDEYQKNSMPTNWLFPKTKKPPPEKLMLMSDVKPEKPKIPKIPPPPSKTKPNRKE